MSVSPHVSLFVRLTNHWSCSSKMINLKGKIDDIFLPAEISSIRYDQPLRLLLVKHVIVTVSLLFGRSTSWDWATVLIGQWLITPRPRRSVCFDLTFDPTEQNRKSPRIDSDTAGQRIIYSADRPSTRFKCWLWRRENFSLSLANGPWLGESVRQVDESFKLFIEDDQLKNGKLVYGS